MKKLFLILAGASALALVACGGPAQTRIYDRDPGLPDNLPFSSAVVVGDTIYLSGEIGRKPGTMTLVEGGVGAETTQILKNIEATLKRLNADLSDVVKCTVFLDDMNEYAAMNAAYAEAFPGDKPARSTFGADGLAMGAALEIECLAVRK
jgi:2-iminobutanoate/2-iminopropanoate deaminase